MKSNNKSLSNVKLVMFDLDGTLLDSYLAIEKALNVVRSKFNLESISLAEVKRAIGRGDKSLIEDYFSEDISIEALSFYRQVHKDTLLEYAKFLPYTEEILKYLKEREYLLALGTNRPAVFTNLIIEHLGINKLFDYVVCGDELEAFKPNPEMILKTLEKFDLDITEIVYVGDMVIDLETASNAGVRSIAITTGSNSREELVAGDPFAIIDSLDQLEDFF